VRLTQKPTKTKAAGGRGDEDTGVREKWKVVRGRKERLGYTAERLGLEIEQKVWDIWWCRSANLLGEAVEDEFESGVVGLGVCTNRIQDIQSTSQLIIRHASRWAIEIGGKSKIQFSSPFLRLMESLQFQCLSTAVSLLRIGVKSHVRLQL